MHFCQVEAIMEYFSYKTGKKKWKINPLYCDGRDRIYIGQVGQVVKIMEYISYKTGKKKQPTLPCWQRLCLKLGQVGKVEKIMEYFSYKTGKNI